MPTTRHGLFDLLECVGQFVVKQKGSWEHPEWEALMEHVGKSGFILEDEGKRNLGNLLEAAKYFYQTAPKKALAKKTTAKKKTAAKKPAK